MSNREVTIELNDGRSIVFRGFIRNRDRRKYVQTADARGANYVYQGNGSQRWRGRCRLE